MLSINNILGPDNNTDGVYFYEYSGRYACFGFDNDLVSDRRQDSTTDLWPTPNGCHIYACMCFQLGELGSVIPPSTASKNSYVYYVHYHVSYQRCVIYTYIK